MVLKNNTRVNILKSDLHAIVDMSEKALPSNLSSVDDPARNMEIKCNPASAACFPGVFSVYLGLARPALI